MWIWWGWTPFSRQYLRATSDSAYSALSPNPPVRMMDLMRFCLRRRMAWLMRSLKTGEGFWCHAAAPSTMAQSALEPSSVCPKWLMSDICQPV